MSNEKERAYIKAMIRFQKANAAVWKATKAYLPIGTRCELRIPGKDTVQVVVTVVQYVADDPSVVVVEPKGVLDPPIKPGHQIRGANRHVVLVCVLRVLEPAS